MNRAQFAITTDLQYQVKGLTSQVEAFQSGAKYQQMNADYRKLEREMLQERKQLLLELSRAHEQLRRNRNLWFQVFDDVEKDNRKQLLIRDRKIKELEERILEVERQRDAAQDKVTELRRECYAVKTELEEEKGRNLQLTAQINRDYENSSKPSSASLNHKKIANSREKTDRRPGGQPGHPGYKRRSQEPTERHHLSAPKEALEDPDFRKTKKVIAKQMVNLHISLDVIEYCADVYYNSKTGERVHAAFPEGFVNDVNYGGTVKALLFLLTNQCNTSIDNALRFLSDITEGKLKLSKGMVSGLGREFSARTKGQRKKTFADLLLSPVLHTDCTNACVNGKSAYVYVCASPDGKVQFYARDKKGHQGVEGTPVETYQGTLIHDHDVTFYHYGTAHQECLAHILRYLKDSMENEQDRTWNKSMYELLREMIHYRKSLSGECEPDPAKVTEFEDQYRDLIRKAREEYEYIPANEYYKDGYNLLRRMDEYMVSHLLFLHDQKIPYTNNLSERLLRSYKRKQRQAVTLRSAASLDYICQSLGWLMMKREEQEKNLFISVAETFDQGIARDSDVDSIEPQAQSCKLATEQ